jgi:hypothetical protein
VDASSNASAGLEDSNTLRVDISIVNIPRIDLYALGGTVAPDAVDVRVLVVVTEADTGKFVADATVTGGPIGRPRVLALGEPPTYSTSHYGAMLTGYERTWEFSVVRGTDYLKEIVLVGPSYPSIAFAMNATTATIGWSPANEGNVTTSLCVWGAAIGPPDMGTVIHMGWCDQGDDEGTAVLSPANLVQGGPTVPLPTPGTTYYGQLLEGLANLPIGLQGGTASFALAVDFDTTVSD